MMKVNLAGEPRVFARFIQLVEHEQRVPPQVSTHLDVSL